MPFLVSQGCVIRFSDSTLELAGIRLTYTNQRGQPLQSAIQASRTTVLLPGQERILQCNLASKNFLPERLVASVCPQLLVATSLHQLWGDRVLRDSKGVRLLVGPAY